MNSSSLFLVICLMFGVALPTQAAVRALVIGIDNYPGGDRLSSCVNDARGMADLLTKQFGVPKNNVRLLLNADASANGIRKAFKEHILDGTKPGDEAFFFFSGHGTIGPNWTDNPGRLMKAMVSYFQGKTYGMADLFTHAELKDLLGQLQTTNITVVLDCCHAGSMTKSINLPTPEYKIKAMNIGFGAAEKYLKEEPREETQVFSKSVSANIPVLWLGACLSNQVSYCGGKMSRFTGTLVEHLQGKHLQTMAEAFPVIQAEVERQTSKIPPEYFKGVQTPILEGPAARLLVKAAADTTPSVSPPLVTPTVQVPVQPTLTPTPTTPAAIAPPSQQQFPLQVSIDRNQYVAGDVMQVRVSTGADCYVRLYLMNAATEIQQLFPNSYATNNFVAKDTVITIPSPDTFVLRMGEPFGTETIVAVASTEQFTDLFKLNYSGGVFQNVGQMKPAQTMTRGINIESAHRPTPAQPTPSGPKISFSSVQYTVSPR